MTKTLNDYMQERYTVILIEEEDGSYFARIKELPGCMTVGTDLQNALEMLEDAKREWLACAFEHNDPIPLPEAETQQPQQYSGKIHLRAPKSLHRKLAEQAVADGVSMNTYIVSLLAEKSAQQPWIRIFQQFCSKTASYTNLWNYPTQATLNYVPSKKHQHSHNQGGC